MKVPVSFILISSAALSAARPFAARSFSAPLAVRTVSSLDQAATAEAQQKDNTATRAFTGQAIKTSDGKCFTVDPLSGDFRENLTPVQLLPCNGSDDNNVAGSVLIVSSLTNACLNFDDRRAAGDKVNLFSCGGRADGGGQVTDSQLFAFNGFKAPFTLVPRNKANTCMTSGGARLDETSCNNSANQVFTIGNGAASNNNTPPANNSGSNNSNPGSGSCGVTTSSTTLVVTVTTTVATTSAAQTTSAPPPTNNNADTNDAAITNPILDPSKTVSVSRAGGVLNPTAAAEAMQRDNTATRAFTNVQLKSANGQCLFIDPTAGDFRENLIPIQLKACDNSDNEKFDIITAGKHNNAKNSMLIVSSLTQGCINFDDRRADGDKVIIFSCGGRADGDGQTTDSQLFPFSGSNTFPLAPENAKNQTCLVPKGNLLDIAGCTGGNDQLFTIIGGGAAAPPTTTSAVVTTTQVTTSAAATTTQATTTAAQTTKADTTTAAQTTAPPVNNGASNNNGAIANPILDPSKTISVSRAGGVLNPTAAAEAMQRDDTATRAFTNVQLKSANGQCLFIDPTAGDFRENLIPVQFKACDNSDNEKFDIITSGKHNNAKNSMLIVSSLTQGCLNFDDRRAAGDKVIMFSCGGRADGDGQTTDSQLFPFSGSTTFPLAPENAKNQTCMVANGNLLDVAACTGGNEQLFTIVGGGAAAPPPVTTTPAASKTTTSSTAATTTAPPTNNGGSNNNNGIITNPILDPSKTVSVSRAGGVLNPTAAAESMQRDNTATRVFSSVQLKSANGQCLFIDPTAGDFRENLIPVQLKACDGSDNQKFDLITSGKHNNAQNSALIVSALTQGCLNFDDRRADGDKVIMFSCGGRADGDGQTTDSQLFPFSGSKTLVLAPENAKNQTCLVPKGGLLDIATCTGGNDQTFTIV